jgi:drug/metabolite transporter (DMT)-like permease
MSNESSFQTVPQAALPLAYEPPQPKSSTSGNWGTVLVSLFVCGTSIAIFALEEEGRRYRNGQTEEAWPAAIAVLALAAMGTAIGFFLTRKR